MEKEVINLLAENLQGHDYYNRCSTATLLHLFQQINHKNGENDKVVDPATQIEEWSEGPCKCKGLRKNGKKSGIARSVWGWCIALRQFKDDQLHGLSIKWDDDGNITVALYKNGSDLGWIQWNTRDWIETRSYNKSVLDSILTIDDFRP